MTEIRTSPVHHGYLRRTHHRSLPWTLARLLLLGIILGGLPAANATFSIARCCTLAVRQDFNKYYEEYYPWQVCNFNTEINYGNNQTFPSIIRSMAWAKEYCRGTQYSSLKQWLLPLSTYISPYIGVLMLSPLGDIRHREYIRYPGLFWHAMNIVLNMLRQPLQEYGSILGDPASATFGALHEIWSDMRTLKDADYAHTGMSWLESRAKWVTALAGDIGFTAHTRWNPDIPRTFRGKDTTSSTTSDVHTIVGPSKSASIVPYSDGTADEAKDSIQLRLLSPSEPSIENIKHITDRVNRAIEMIIVARKGFVSGILIPVVLMLAVTAATFYDAYSNTGDKDTALDLAYCVWYSWILVLGVAGNCYASSLKPEVAQSALYKVIDFGEDPLETPLRHRYVNNYLWDEWARSPDSPPSYQKSLDKLRRDLGFWSRFCLGQGVGLCCVAFASACATAIAWTTPTVGLGCRSFNFILYVAIAFVAAYLNVLCSWLGVCAKSTVSDAQRKQYRVLWKLVRSIYAFLVFGNALVMVVGTIFHLVGVFRTCWCERLTWADSTLIELNSKTQQAYDNARRYWLSTAYVAFGVVWLACLVAIAFRSYIVQKLDDWVRESDEERQRQEREAEEVGNVGGQS